jgi:ornithine cyclodeaminase
MDVDACLAGREQDLIGIVRETYLSYADGQTVAPQSMLLRLPGRQRRIVGLPAHIAGPSPRTGLTWASSFPGNVSRGIERTSSVIVLNDPETGQPTTFLEGALISVRCAAASAAVAASILVEPDEVDAVSLLGCGALNFEVLRFLGYILPNLKQIDLHDVNSGQAWAFADRVKLYRPDLRIEIWNGPSDVHPRHPLVSIATTAPEPHLDVRDWPQGMVVLHLSLRDINCESILASRNVVDDADHVCRADTSLQQAELAAGDRNFIAASIGELLRSGHRHHVRDQVTVFSPFGIGVLDVAVADAVRSIAVLLGLGQQVPDFL